MFTISYHNRAMSNMKIELLQNNVICKNIKNITCIKFSTNILHTVAKCYKNIWHFCENYIFRIILHVCVHSNLNRRHLYAIYRTSKETIVFYKLHTLPKWRRTMVRSAVCCHNIDARISCVIRCFSEKVL